MHDRVDVVAERLAHRLGDLFVGGQVDHSGDPVVPQRVGHQVEIADITVHERNLYPLGGAGAEVVHHHRADATGLQTAHHVSPDVARAACHQPGICHRSSRSSRVGRIAFRKAYVKQDIGSTMV